MTELESAALYSIIHDKVLYLDIADYPAHLFDSSEGRILFDAVKQSYKDIGECSVTHLYSVIPDKNYSVYILDVIQARATSSVMAKVHVKKLIDEFKKRQIDSVCIEAQQCPDYMTSSEILSHGVAEVRAFGTDNAQHISEIVHEDMKVCQEFLKTGISGIDDFIHGFAKSEVVIIGAKPKIGKTTLALQIGSNFSKEHYGCFYSLEMKASDIATKLLSRVSRVPYDQIITGTIENMPAYKDAVRQIHDKRFNFKVVDDLFRIESIVAHMEREIVKHGAAWMVVDYLQLVEPSDRKMGRYLQVGEISRSLKLLANKYNIVVIALSQLTGEGEPTMEMFRESGNIAADCNIPILLHPVDGQIKVIQDRSRRAEARSFYMCYRGDICSFEDIRSTKPIQSWAETTEPGDFLL